MNSAVTKRIAVYLPDAVHAELERWANEESRPTSNLAAFILESVIREQIDRGIIPQKFQKEKS